MPALAARHRPVIRRWPRHLTVGVLGLGLMACAERTPAPPPMPEWLAARVRAQVAGAATTVARHDLRFTDRAPESGITFVHRIVDDAGRAYKPVHYDHGTGVAAADVDGDGHPDLFFVSQRGRSELWRNRGDGTFEDHTAAAGLVREDAIAVGAAFADIDNDGDPDLYVTTVRHGNRLYENDGTGRFQDISAAAGVAYDGHSSAALFFDYDRDGRADLFVSNVGRYTADTLGDGGYHVGMEGAFYAHTRPERAEASRLYRNLGGNRFADVTRAVGVFDAAWNGEAVPMDVDGDGWTDLYLPNMQGEDRLYLNRDGRRFVEATARVFPRTPFGAMGAEVLDWDGDGRLDLFVTDMHSDMFDHLAPEDVMREGMKFDPATMPPALFPAGTARLLFGNALFTARGPGATATTYEEMSDRAGVESYWPWGPSADDLNADGYDDLFITSGMNFPYRYMPNTVLLNEAGRRFLPAEFLLGVEPRRGGVTDQPWFTLACEAGGADAGTRNCAVCAAPNAAALGCRRGLDGRLTMWGSRGSRSAVILDLDSDGDLDIVTNEFNAGPQVLVSDLSDRGDVRTLVVRLTGTRATRQGLGALVRVTLGDGRRVLKVMDGKTGYLGQSALPLTFGLGASGSARAVEVTWPSGRVQTVTPPADARAIDIVEPPAD